MGLSLWDIFVSASMGLAVISNVAKTLNGFVFGAARLILISAVALAPAVPAHEAGTLRGVLLDLEGLALSNAEIELRWNNVDNEMSAGIGANVLQNGSVRQRNSRNKDE
jgi:hypothetical protein